ncbi:hypothetical protein [Brevibacillus sp. SIMBA_076]|uniref:hypothetical protein n=1 Tax=Brevibacillus sp. SIMBA_076 TaxID=3085814 RepID=UPI003978DAF5
MNQWKKYRLEGYQRSGQIKLLRKIEEELVEDGDYACYQKIKDTYLTTDWSPIYRNLLQRFV